MKGSHAAAFLAILTVAFLTDSALVAAGFSGNGGDARDSIRLSEILSSLRDETGDPYRAETTGRVDAFDRIMGHRAYPSSCATPFVLALHQASPTLPERARRLVERLGRDPATSPGNRTLTFDSDPAAGSFRLHYSTDPARPGALRQEDEDLDGVPDDAQRISGLIREARAAIQRTLEQNGMSTAALDAGGAPLDVEITDLPGEVAAWLAYDRKGPILLLDRDGVLSSDGPAILRHQMVHLRQLALSIDESPWWYEADAVWAEDPTGLHIGKLGGAVSAYLLAQREGLEPDNVAAWEGAVLWPHYLKSGGGGSGLLSAAWEEMAAVPGNNTLPAFDSALRRARGIALADEARSFRLWNLFTGDADDGNHYPFGADLPSIPLPSFRTQASAYRGSDSIPPLGSMATRLIADSGPGGWTIDFTGSPGATWDVSVVTLPSRLDAAPRLAEFRLEEGQRGASSIPWHDLAGVVLVVQNLGGERRVPQRFNLIARYDPVAPFDLLSFTAEPEEQAVALRWTTENEKGVAGWMIYRSRDPVHGFVPINSIQFPATGGSGSASYLFLDADVHPGRKYYYFVEGVTREGFAGPSYVTAARLPQSADDSRPR